MTIVEKIEYVRAMLYDLWTLQGEKDVVYLLNEKLPPEIDKTIELPDILIKFKRDGIIEDFEEGYGAMKPGGEIAAFGHIENRPSITVEDEKGRKTKMLASTSMWKIKLNAQALVRGLDKKVVLQMGKRKQIVPPSLPSGTKWEDITIKFLDGHEVLIQAKDFSQHATYSSMGFEDERKKTPNKLWEFLKGLSEIGGELSWNNPKASDKGKKNKQLLSDALKVYFGIDEDPFYPYKEEKAYKIKMQLVPETDEKESTKDSW